jgi:hypothetical protein
MLKVILDTVATVETKTYCTGLELSTIDEVARSDQVAVSDHNYVPLMCWPSAFFHHFRTETCGAHSFSILPEC